MENKRKQFLKFAVPSIDENEINEVMATLKSGWITTGPKTQTFEKDFASYLNAESALALSSGTAGLEIALTTLGIGSGDQVITTPMTFCSTVAAIQSVGASPILVDIQPDTLNIDPAKIKEAIEQNSNVKAILPVHYGGHPCDMDAILALARDHQLKVVEDAAHAVPAEYKGKKVGTIGDMTAFSFYVTKNITTAEGGMLTGTDSENMKRARLMSLHGISHDAWNRYSEEGSWYYEVLEQGFKANMSDIQASLGIHQLKKINQFHQRRKEIAASYTEAFSTLSNLEVPTCHSDVEHAWHLYVLRLHPDQISIGRNEFIEELKKLNIGTSVHFIPVYMHPYFKQKLDCSEKDFPVTSSQYQRMLSLPIYPDMTDQDVQDVINAVSYLSREYQK